MTSAHGTGTNPQHQRSAPSKVTLMIHHQCPGIELVSPVYACDGAICYLSPDQKVHVGSTTQANFNTVFCWKKSLGILMYELKNTKQFNKSAISSEDEARCIQLFMTWKVDVSKEFCVYSCLIEHDRRCVWDKDKLLELARRYKLHDIHVPIEMTYLMRDNTVLMKRVNVIREEDCYKLEMTISQGSIKYDTWMPRYVDVVR
jgi:hypothetical protein